MHTAEQRQKRNTQQNATAENKYRYSQHATTNAYVRQDSNHSQSTRSFDFKPHQRVEESIVAAQLARLRPQNAPQTLRLLSPRREVRGDLQTWSSQRQTKSADGRGPFARQQIKQADLNDDVDVGQIDGVVADLCASESVFSCETSKQHLL